MTTQFVFLSLLFLHAQSISVHRESLEKASRKPTQHQVLQYCLHMVSFPLYFLQSGCEVRNLLNTTKASLLQVWSLDEQPEHHLKLTRNAVSSGGAMDKNPSARQRTQVSSLVSKFPHATEQLRPCTAVLSRSLEPMCRNS